MIRVSVLLVLLLCAWSAGAQPSADEKCVAAHEAAQLHRKAEALIEARDALRSCAEPQCPVLVVTDCTRWLEEVERDLPTIVIDAHGPDGKSLSNVRVSLDGRPWSERVTLEPIAVPLGEHTLRIEQEASRSVERTMTFAKGDKDTRVSIVLEPLKKPAPTPSPPRSKPPAPDRGPSPAGWVLGAAGIVGLGLFAGFGASGLSRRGDLDDSGCKPRCPDEDVDAMERDFLVADVALGIGAAALVAGVIVLAATWNSGDSETAALFVGDHGLGVSLRY